MAHTLLLADDSVTIQRVIELTFADEDVRVVAVSDGDQAIAALEKSTPDIVLADIGMPGRNGYQVAEHIKNTPRLAHIPVMLLTGAFEPVDQAKAKAAGCDGVLAKPFEPQLVIGRVRELLSKPKQPAAVAPGPIVAASAATKLEPAVKPELTIKPEAPKLTSILPPRPAPPTETRAEKTDYFARLDKAFASLSTQPPSTSPAAAAEQEPAVESADWVDELHPEEKAATPESSFVNRWESPPAAPAGGRPASYTAPVAKPAIAAADNKLDHAFAPPTRPDPVVESTESGPSRGSMMNERPVTPPTLPPLADAFAALLAAEQSAPAPSAAPVWPASSPAAVTDDLIEQVTRRVLERLSDRVMREAVGKEVAAVAERLVREEIQKIKSAIK